MTADLNERKGVAYRAVFRMKDASAGFDVEFPDLPGCVGGGGDFVQARAHAKRALDAWIDASLHRGESVPGAASREPPRPAARTFWVAARSGFEQRRVHSPRRAS